MESFLNPIIEDLHKLLDFLELCWFKLIEFHKSFLVLRELHLKRLLPFFPKLLELSFLLHLVQDRFRLFFKIFKFVLFTHKVCQHILEFFLQIFKFIFLWSFTWLLRYLKLIKSLLFLSHWWLNLRLVDFGSKAFNSYYVWSLLWRLVILAWGRLDMVILDFGWLSFGVGLLNTSIEHFESRALLVNVILFCRRLCFLGLFFYWRWLFFFRFLLHGSWLLFFGLLFNWRWLFFLWFFLCWRINLWLWAFRNLWWDLFELWLNNFFFLFFGSWLSFTFSFRWLILSLLLFIILNCIVDIFKILWSFVFIFLFTSHTWCIFFIIL